MGATSLCDRHWISITDVDDTIIRVVIEYDLFKCFIGNLWFSGTTPSRTKVSPKFEDDFGIRIMESRHFVPVASQYKLPYEMRQAAVFNSEALMDSDMWQDAYEAGCIPFSVMPLNDITNIVSVSEQNKGEMALLTK